MVCVVSMGFRPRAECAARTAFGLSIVAAYSISDGIVFNLQNYEEIPDWQNFVLVGLGVKNLLLAGASEIS